MPLSLDSIRNLAGTGGILYSQKDGLQSVGTTQRLKSFFDVGDARQKNAEPAGGYARYDYDTAIDAFEDKMRALFDRLGDGPGDKEVLSACIKSFRDGGGGGGLKAQDKLERIVDQFKANLDESRALGAQYGEQTRLDVVEMLKTFGRPIKTDAATPAPIRTIVETGRALPLGELRSLNANSSPTAINDALVNFLMARDRALVASVPQGETDDAQVAFRRTWTILRESIGENAPMSQLPRQKRPMPPLRKS